LCSEDHISRRSATSAALGDVKVPVGATVIIARGVAKSAGGAIDGAGVAFEFEECTGGGLVEVESELREPIGRSIFLVAEAGAETERAQDLVPAGWWIPDHDFPFELFFVSPRADGARASRGFGFGGQDRSGGGGARVPTLGGRRSIESSSAGCRDFYSDAQQGAAATEVGIGCVVECVPFEDTTFVGGAEAVELAVHLLPVEDAQLHFDFAIRAAMGTQGGFSIA
jgi:hypothetical protein